MYYTFHFSVNTIIIHLRLRIESLSLLYSHKENIADLRKDALKFPLVKLLGPTRVLGLMSCDIIIVLNTVIRLYYTFYQ